VRFAWLLVLAACHHGAAPSDAPSCAAAADHVRGLLGPRSPRAGQIRDTFAMRCETDGWDDDARACVVATSSLSKPRHCKARLTADQRTALDRDLALVAATRASAQLPSACREYGAMLDKLGTCPSMSEAIRGSLIVAYRQLTQSWLRGTADLQAMELQCRAMIDGLRQAGQVRCGW
jgi:hypothetical protein